MWSVVSGRDGTEMESTPVDCGGMEMESTPVDNGGMEMEGKWKMAKRNGNGGR